MIRQGTPDDIEEMAILWRMMIKEILPGSDIQKNWWIKYQAEMMKTDLYRAYVAFYENVMVGFVCGMIYPDATTGKTIGFGQDFYVVPEFRDENISKLLYRKIVVEGKKKGMEAVEMTCFEGQLGLWQKKGFDIHKYHMRRVV